MADLSNNPFIDHTASVASRFPDINAVSPPPGPSSPQYAAGWQQQQQPQQQYSGFVGTSPTGYTQQYAQQPQWPPPQQQQQQQQQYHSQVQASYPPASYQTTSFGQQLGQVDTRATGYPQPHLQAQAQYTGYPTQQSEYGYQQPQQTGYGYPPQQLLAQFDPYTNLGQFSPTTRAAALPTASGIVGSPPPGVQHPRAFIHSHKAELEAWDPTTWRQVQNTFESLKMAWEIRKRTAESQVRALGGVPGAPAAGAGFFGGGGGYGGYGGGYQTPQAQEVDRLNAVRPPSTYSSPGIPPLICSLADQGS